MCDDVQARQVPRRHHVSYLLLLGCLSRSAFATSYTEAFEGLADPSAITAAGWSLVSGTNNPTTVSTAFAINNNENVVKITAVNDAGSQFTSAHLFVEKDFWTTSPPDNGVDPNNFGAGDALVYTTEPVTLFAASSININGALISVDYSNGDANNSGPAFYFAFRLQNGTWWVYETVKLGLTTSAVTHAALSTDPLDNTFTFLPLIFNPNNGFNPDVRLIPDDTFARELTTAELSAVTAVGLYLAPGIDASPARFDNYTITNYTLNPDCTGLNFCNNQGTCTAANVCTCFVGWLGLDCSIPSCAGVGECSGHGVCTAPDTCLCDSYWTNPDCSTSSIPAVSTWGLSVAALLLLAAGSVLVSRRGSRRIRV